MHPYSQPAGVPAFNPSQFASQGQIGAAPFGNQGFASQPGSTYGAPSAGSQPFLTDPAAAYAQQQPQLQQSPQFAQPGVFGFPQGQQSQQGAFGSPQGLQSQPFAQQGAFGLPQAQQSQPFGLPQLGAGQIPRLPTFLPDPTLAAYAHQLQLAQLAQQFAPSPFGIALGQFAQPFISSANLINPAFAQLGGVAQFPRPSPFADPLAAIYAQQLLQAQLAQQFMPPGFFGAPLPQFAQPFGAGIGSIFANPALAASQFGRYPPFAAPILH